MSSSTTVDKTTPRWIDRIQPSQNGEKPMQVLCLGLSRTGTMSMWTALKQLGYTPYHFKEIRRNVKDKHLMCWREALIAKLYGSGKQYGKPEFDKLLLRYDAVTDAPCVNFSEELLAAYPDAKVILTKREPGKWLESILRSYYAVIGSSVFRVAAAIDPAFSILEEVLRLVLCHWTGGDWRSQSKLLEGYHAHNELIRSLVSPDQLLEWEPKDGWKPLCDFLNKPVPEEPFPYSNKGDDVANGLIFAARARIAATVVKKSLWPSAAVGVFYALFCSPYLAAWRAVLRVWVGVVRKQVTLAICR